MSLVETYESIEPAIVAIASRYAVVGRHGPPPYPSIVGTGFVVDSSGLIATNRHVVEAFDAVAAQHDHQGDEFPVSVIAYCRRAEGLHEFYLEVTRATYVSGYDDPTLNATRGVPDLALLKVRAKGMQPVTIEEQPSRVGTEIGTAGFPMGTAALVAPGRLHQIAPTLQRGIVSAVLPYEQEIPDGYAINVMVQGGASGSPVFRTSDGKVIGVVHSGLREGVREEAPRGEPTNISYVAPSHALLQALEMARADGMCEELPDAMSIEEMEHGLKPVDRSVHGPPWIKRDPPGAHGPT